MQEFEVLVEAISVVIFTIFLFYAVRSYLIVKQHKELQPVRHLWQPVAVGGVLAAGWGIGDLFMDVLVPDQVEHDTLMGVFFIFVSLIFLFSMVRLTRLWGDYASRLATSKGIESSTINQIIERLAKDHD